MVDKQEHTLDTDEDAAKPQYVPKRGIFYQHDVRTADKTLFEEDIETQVSAESRRTMDDSNKKWVHDLYEEEQQAPKSRQELIDTYGYDIRLHNKPPPPPRGRPNTRPKLPTISEFVPTPELQMKSCSKSQDISAAGNVTATNTRRGKPSQHIPAPHPRRAEPRILEETSAVTPSITPGRAEPGKRLPAKTSVVTLSTTADGGPSSSLDKGKSVTEAAHVNIREGNKVEIQPRTLGVSRRPLPVQGRGRGLGIQFSKLPSRVFTNSSFLSNLHIQPETQVQNADVPKKVEQSTTSKRYSAQRPAQNRGKALVDDLIGTQLAEVQPEGVKESTNPPALFEPYDVASLSESLSSLSVGNQENLQTPAYQISSYQPIGEAVSSPLMLVPQPPEIAQTSVQQNTSFLVQPPCVVPFYTPESTAAFNQKMALLFHDKNLNSWMYGAHTPLFQFPQSAGLNLVDSQQQELLNGMYFNYENVPSQQCFPKTTSTQSPIEGRGRGRLV